MKKQIKILGMDVDGTLTDGKIHVSKDGEHMKSFDVKDGYGIKILLPSLGITPVIISARDSDIVRVRAKELNIPEVHLGVADKLQTLKNLLIRYEMKLEDVAFIGDDLNDIPVLNCVGLSFAPSDAVDEVKRIANVTLEKNGGCGAVRECIEYISKKYVEGK